MKADERAFAIAMLQHGWREGDTSGPLTWQMIESLGLPPKRAWYLLGKWAARGWYSYGVSIDRGWLTPEGAEVFRALLA